MKSAKLPVDEWTRKMCHVYTENIIKPQRSKILSLAATQIEWKIIVLSERIQMHKDNHHLLSPVWIPQRQLKIREQ